MLQQLFIEKLRPPEALLTDWFLCQLSSSKALENMQYWDTNRILALSCVDIYIAPLT